MGSQRFKSKVCLVNGAASLIGQAVAERLASEGAVVVGADIVEHSVGERALQVDLTDENKVQEMYQNIIDSYGALHAIYNNVGLQDAADGSALNLDLETWQRVNTANLTSIFLACRYGIPHLRQNEDGGAVLNSASFLAHVGAASALMAYSAAKAGVVQLSRDLGVHLAKSGVRVNSVSFGPIETPAQRKILERSPGVLEKRLVHWPTGRFGTLTEAAATVAFLLSDDAGFITASDIPLDGGITKAFTVPE